MNGFWISVAVVAALLIYWLQPPARTAAPLDSIFAIEQLLKRLVTRGAKHANVRFQVRGDPGRAIVVRKLLRGADTRHGPFTTFSPQSELSLTSTVRDSEQLGAAFGSLQATLRARGIRYVIERDRSRNATVRVEHGGDWRSAAALVELFFAVVLQVKVPEDLEASYALFTSMNAPHLTGVNAPD